jgi:hypothetical protein
MSCRVRVRVTVAVTVTDWVRDSGRIVVGVARRVRVRVRLTPHKLDLSKNGPELWLGPLGPYWNDHLRVVMRRSKVSVRSRSRSWGRHRGWGKAWG